MTGSYVLLQYFGASTVPVPQQFEGGTSVTGPCQAGGLALAAEEDLWEAEDGNPDS